MEIMGVIGVMVNCALIGNHSHRLCFLTFTWRRPVWARAPPVPRHDQRPDRAPDHCVGAPHAAPQVPHLSRNPRHSALRGPGQRLSLFHIVIVIVF